MQIFDPTVFFWLKTHLGVFKKKPARSLKKEFPFSKEKVFRLEDVQTGA